MQIKPNLHMNLSQILANRFCSFHLKLVVMKNIDLCDSLIFINFIWFMHKLCKWGVICIDTECLQAEKEIECSKEHSCPVTGLY